MSEYVRKLYKWTDSMTAMQQTTFQKTILPYEPFISEVTEADYPLKVQ